MPNVLVVSLLALLVPLTCLPASPVHADDKGTVQQYCTPTAVFEAYREARSMQQWRKVFSLLTAESQDDLVFESFFACAVHDTKETRAIVKKYLDEAAFDAALKEGYKKRYGIDADTEDGAAKIQSLGDSDRPLLVEVLAGQIKDKAEFVEAVTNTQEKAPIPTLGKLEQLVVKGDTATGRALVPLPWPVGETRPEQLVHRQFDFKKVNGGWLLDHY